MITDGEGNEEWSNLYGTESSEKGFAINLTLDGGFIIAGKFSSPQSGYIVRIDSSGEQLWDQFDERFREFQTVLATEDGGIVLGGLYKEDDVWDMGVIKIDADGEEEWLFHWGGDGSEECYQVINTSDGGFLAVGFTSSFGAGRNDAYLIKLNEDGEEEWTRTYGTGIGEIGYAVVEAEEGGYVLAGSVFEGGDFNDYDALLIRVDENGEELWTQTYGGGQDDLAFSIVSNESGGFTFAGRSRSYRGYNSLDFYLVRTDSDGEELWSTVYGNGRRGSEQCNSLLMLEDDSYTLFGSTTYFEDDERDEPNMWLLKTGPDPAGVPILLDPTLPSQFAIIGAYPNPFNSSTTVAFQIPQQTNVEIKLLDIHGRVISTLTNGRYEAGRYYARWNGRDVPSGMYFCEIRAADFVKSTRLALIK